jgi:predicted Zn-dependent peptidase
LDVTIETIESLAGEIGEDEVDRLKTRVRTSLTMEQESSMARCSQMASDYYYFRRVPSHEEVKEAIFALTPETLSEHFRSLRRDWSLVAIGPNELELPS